MPRREAGAKGAVAGQAPKQPGVRPTAGDVVAASGTVNPQAGKPLTYKPYVAAVGTAWLTLSAGLLVGTAGSLVSLIVGAVRGLRR